MERKVKSVFGKRPGGSGANFQSVYQNPQLLEFLTSDEPSGDEVADFLRASWKLDASKLALVSQSITMLERKMEEAKRGFDQGLGAVGRMELLIAQRMDIDLEGNEDGSAPPSATPPDPEGGEGKSDE